MQFIPLSFIPGAYEILLNPFADERGFFSRVFCAQEFQEIGFQTAIVQINHSLNRIAGTVRGMHFQQTPFAEAKIIRCLRGKVFDVIVDLRAGSPGFLKWQSIELTPEKYNMILIPEGCAHGFQTLEDNTELLYLHTSFYKPESEAALRYDDPMIGIKWPLEPVQVSERDKNHPLLTRHFKGI